MSIPEWADSQLSNDLLALVQRGEDQHLEFKVEFPSNANELAKEIAAFATSNAGRILLGISDSGQLVGLNGVSDAIGRDELLKRLAGICRTAVQPALTPDCTFAALNDKIVLAVDVPKGRHPVYYSNNKPYLRHLTEARPAQPDEVVELIRSWLPASGIVDGTEQERELGEFYGQLAGSLIDVLIYGDQYEDRLIKPWLEILRTQFAYIATVLRDLAATSIAEREAIYGDLEGLAILLDHTANLRLKLGSADDLISSISAATEKARELKATKIDVQPLSEQSLMSVRESLIRSRKKLESLTVRAEEMVISARTEELQREASALGYNVLRLAYFNLDSLSTGLSDPLHDIGKDLHLIETHRLKHDGGRSKKQILDIITSCNTALTKCLAPLR